MTCLWDFHSVKYNLLRLCEAHLKRKVAINRKFKLCNSHLNWLTMLPLWLMMCRRAWERHAAVQFDISICKHDGGITRS